MSEKNKPRDVFKAPLFIFSGVHKNKEKNCKDNIFMIILSMNNNLLKNLCHKHHPNCVKYASAFISATFETIFKVHKLYIHDFLKKRYLLF